MLVAELKVSAFEGLLNRVFGLEIKAPAGIVGVLLDEFSIDER